MENLKPCPFCGGEAETDFGFEDHDTKTYFYVVCLKCGAEAIGCKTKAEAIAAWNRRFVRLDRNGKKVYAGDKVMVINDDGDIEDMQPITLGGQIVSYRGDVQCITDPSFNYAIELIEEKKRSDDNGE